MQQTQRATQAQISYLRSLGYTGETDSLSRQRVSRMIEEWKNRNRPSCHYCGMPATGFGFFDEPCCTQCGSS